MTGLGPEDCTRLPRADETDLERTAERIANGLERYAELHIRIRQLDNDLAALRGEPWIWGDDATPPRRRNRSTKP